MDLSLINIGGPCKITDVSQVIYSEGDVQLVPNPVYRGIASSVGGVMDDVLVGLTWTIRFTPKSIWSAGYRASLLPDALTNWTTSGARIIGAANRAVTILGADGEQFIFNRAALTKMPEVYLGLGNSLYGEAEFTAFIKTAAVPADTDAFYTQSTGVSWSQADFPTSHQEAICTGAWGAVSGWTTIYAEEGFRLSHELALEPVKQGNILVDYKVIGYRAGIMFKPQGPTSAQVLTGLGLQGASRGIGTRRTANANNMVVTGSGISVTVGGAALNKGSFVFDSKMNRHGEVGMITALTAPAATRLTLA